MSNKRDERRKAGLCTRCGGKREDKEYLMCEKCRENSRRYAKEKSFKNPTLIDPERVIRDKERRKKLIEHRKERGLCVYCGKENDDPDRVSCRACRRKIANMRKEEKQYKERIGMCNICGIVPVFGDEKRCPECRYKAWEYAQKNKGMSDEQKEKINEYRRAKRKKYIESGLCACGRKREEGYRTCSLCRIKNRERARRLYQKKHDTSMEEMLHRPENGLCIWCGKNVKCGKNRNGEPFRVCEECYKKSMDKLKIANSKRKTCYWKKDNNIVFSGRNTK